MNTRQLYRTEAIVLRLLDYGEADRIVTFCTAGYGKVRGIAKGARRSRKRFANTLEPFCLSQLNFTRRGPDSLAMIDASEVISHFSRIRSDLELSLKASYLIDLTDQFLPEEKKNEAVFLLLKAFLDLFELIPAAAESLVRFFEIRLLKLAGYDPLLDRCLLCKAPAGESLAYRFVPADGGIVCPSCRSEMAETVSVSLGTIRSLVLGRDMPIDRLGRIVLTGQSAEESRQLLARFIRHLLGRELKSIHVLNEIRRLGI
ncbi:MAG: DNA repair protein RecO [Syntrophales bacterium]